MKMFATPFAAVWPQAKRTIAHACRIMKFLPRSIPALAFLGVGFTYLLCQKKMLPQPMSRVVSKLAFFPTMPMTAMSRLGNYWTEIDDTIVLGCAPFAAAGHPQIMYDMGVRGVVNLCEEYRGPVGAYSELGITQLHLPTTDHFESSVEQLEEAVTFIEMHRSKGERVYVHCKAGHGRGGAVVLADLIKENPRVPPATLNAALSGLRKVRKTLHKQDNIQSFITRLANRDANWLKKTL